MKWLAVVRISGMFAAVPFCQGSAEGCSQVAVQSRVEAGQGELTLADLLARGSCPQLRDAAARVSLGVAPRAGSARVLDGRQIRQRLEELAAVSLNLGARLNLEKEISVQVPERIVVRRAGAMKSCAEIASLLAGAAPTRGATIARGQWRGGREFAPARGHPGKRALALTQDPREWGFQAWGVSFGGARGEGAGARPRWAPARDR